MLGVLGVSSLVGLRVIFMPIIIIGASFLWRWLLKVLQDGLRVIFIPAIFLQFFVALDVHGPTGLSK